MVRPRCLRRLYLSLRGGASILFQQPRDVRLYVAYQSPVTARDEVGAVRIPSQEGGALDLDPRRWQRQVVSKKLTALLGRRLCRCAIRLGEQYGTSFGYCCFAPHPDHFTLGVPCCYECSALSLARRCIPILRPESGRPGT